MLEKQPHNRQKQRSRGEGSIKWKTYSHLSYHCLFYEVKCFRKSAVLLCKSIGEDDSFATLFPYGGCCWSLDHIKNTPWCLYLVADTAPLCPCLWNVQFNQTKWPYFWACWEHWDHSYSGLFYMANDSGRTGFSIRSQWSAEKRKLVVHQSRQFPVHLLYVTMAIHVQMQFSWLFIRTPDVTQLSPVS